jgi:hypothetical protein
MARNIQIKSVLGYIYCSFLQQLGKLFVFDTTAKFYEGCAKIRHQIGF